MSNIHPEVYNLKRRHSFPESGNLKKAKFLSQLAIATWGVLLTSLTGCSRNAPNIPKALAHSFPGDEIFVALGADEYVNFQRGFDPTEGWSWDSYSDPLFQSRLLRRDINRGLVKDLAVDYSLSRDRKVWTVKIRSDVHFTDGEPLTAQDIAYTFNTEADPVLEKVLDNAVVTGNDEVQFHLKRPDITFVDKMASLGIVPQHSHNANYSRHPIGSGPYKLVQWVEGEQIVMEANPDYYGNSPRIKRVVLLFSQGDATFAAAKSGRVQIAQVPYPLASKSIPGMQLYNIETLNNTALLFPCTPDSGKKNAQGFPIGNNVTADRAIRLAVNYAINRQKLVDGILWGYGSKVYGFPSGPPWFEPAPAIQDADLEKAKQILAAAGWRDSKGNGIVEKLGVKAEFSLLYTANLPHEQGVALAIAQMLLPLGIKVKPEGSSWEKIKYRADHDAWLYTLVTRPQDLYTLYRSSNKKLNSRPNYSLYTNPVVDSLLDRGLQAASEEEASQEWKQVYWNGKTGIGIPGDAASAWLVKLNDTYLVSKCLDIGRPTVPSQHHQGPLLGNISAWRWACK